MPKHRTGVERSLALHREVARRIVADSAVVDRARERVESWILEGSVPDVYASAWKAILERAPDDIAFEITKDDESAAALRQVSPFAGALDPRARWRILRDVGREHEAQ
jgi:hypothetical protein